MGVINLDGVMGWTQLDVIRRGVIVLFALFASVLMSGAIVRSRSVVLTHQCLTWYFDISNGSFGLYTGAIAHPHNS